MSVEIISLLLLIGFIGGVLNAVAGGSSLITFPALMAVGFPPIVANATNFMGLIASNAAALPAYRHELREVIPKIVPLLILSGIGGLAGALLLLVSDPQVFIALIPFLILFATLMFAFGDRVKAWLDRVQGGYVLGLTILFLASIYGGYFGAGLGIILLAVVQIFGFRDYNRANAIKNLLGTYFSIISIIVFGFGGLIDWPAATVMVVGSTIGGYSGGIIAKRFDNTTLRKALIVYGLLLSGIYFLRNLGAF